MFLYIQTISKLTKSVGGRSYPTEPSLTGKRFKPSFACTLAQHKDVVLACDFFILLNPTVTYIVHNSKMYPSCFISRSVLKVPYIHHDLHKKILEGLQVACHTSIHM